MSRVYETELEGGEGAPAALSAPSLIGQRYRVESLLGEGGMAVVYRVFDTTSGLRVALKRLAPQSSPELRRDVAALFEREFQTLSELRHPRVITVYDFGVDGGQPHYTMELLAGGDLVERAPLPWRDACRVMFDVCSSLALLHSRRLLHRDVSPRNVRFTADGQAKLIDFGAMAGMGHCRQLVGTPAFVSPEVLNRLGLDGRSDLYSAGATLYYALTRRLPHAVRSFTEALDAFQYKPPPPSTFSPDVPPALDALVLSLLNLEATQRPRTAHDVMQRLAALAELPAAEPLSVTGAYLATPALVGRDAPLDRLRDLVGDLRRGKGAAVLLQGSAGSGRTRLLDSCALEAKTGGANVLRAAAAAADGFGEFATAQALVSELIDNLPDLARACAAEHPSLAPLFVATAARPHITALGLERLALQAELQRWFVAVAQRHPLVLTVDDAHACDAASLAWLAGLAQNARRDRLLLVLTAEQRAPDLASDALHVLEHSCELLQLAALSARQTLALVGSVFGDVPNLALLGARVHASSGGNPRDCVDLLRHLSSTGQIHYNHGQWTLPSVLGALELPASAEEALLRRVLQLGPLARRLFETQALASHAAFTRNEYRHMAEASDVALEAALAELIAQELLATEGQSYTLARAGFGKAFAARIAPSDRAELERGLARLYEHKQHAILAARHWLRASDAAKEEAATHDRARAIACIIEFSKLTANPQEILAKAGMSADETAHVIERCLQAAEGVGCSALDLAELRHWLVMLSTHAADHYYHSVAAAWLEQLVRDSGLSRWRELSDVADSGVRLTQALVHAQEQYQAAPEAERVYAPILAIQYLVHYVAASIALGVRSSDGALLASLPALLEPLTPLSPLIHAMWLNAVSTYETTCACQVDRMRERFREALARLRSSTPGDVPTRFVCNSLALGLGLVETRFGLASGEEWIELLDAQEGTPIVDAMYLRKTAALAQGDFALAEQYRRKAELLALQAGTRPMLSSTLGVELGMHALANDLTGVEQVAKRIGSMAAVYPGWQASAHLAEGQRLRLCAQLPQAAAEFERAIALSKHDPNDKTRPMMAWPSAVSAYIETLAELGRTDEAQRIGESALDTCGELGLHLFAHGIRVCLALVEAKQGALDKGRERLDAVIAEQRALGTTGLVLGASFEARTRIAILAGDREQIEHFAQLTANEYRHGTSSALAARYERLLQETSSAGVGALPALSDVRSTLNRELAQTLAETVVSGRRD